MEELLKKYPETIAAILVAMETMEYNGMKPWTVERLFEEKPPLIKALMRDYTLNIHE